MLPALREHHGLPMFRLRCVHQHMRVPEHFRWAGGFPLPHLRKARKRRDEKHDLPGGWESEEFSFVFFYSNILAFGAILRGFVLKFNRRLGIVMRYFEIFKYSFATSFVPFGASYSGPSRSILISC